MAWEATLVLLVLLASGSWGQRSELLQKLEGQNVSMQCRYSRQQALKRKVWCKLLARHICILLATHPKFQAVPTSPRYSIQDVPKSRSFIITMTELRVEDSGFYWCGIDPSSNIIVLRSIHLVVSQGSTLPTTRSARGTTAWVSAISPVTDSPSGHWIIIASVMVALLLLLLLLLILFMYLRKARGKAGTGKNEFHYIHEAFAHEDETTVCRKEPSPGQRESQLSSDSDQQMGSDKDPGDIHYASLTHLNHVVPEDSIYVNTHPTRKPIPDPFLAMEYASIIQHKPQPSKSTALEEEPRM